MKTLITIAAHGAAQEMFDYHLPMWASLGFAIEVVCPENDPVKTMHRLKLIGPASHSGPAAVHRHRTQLLELSMEYDRHFIFEYDSFLLKDPGYLNGLFGVVKSSPEPTRFLAPRYPNPPWMIDRESLRAIQTATHRYPSVVEEGHCDRYYGALAWLAGVPVLDYSPAGVSDNTICACGGHKDVILHGVWRGAFAFHGSKTPATTNFICEQSAKHGKL